MQDIKLGNKVLKNVAAIKVLLVEGEGVYVDSSDATATSADIVNGKTAYLNVRGRCRFTTGRWNKWPTIIVRCFFIMLCL